METKVLDHGFIKFVDSMPSFIEKKNDELTIADAAIVQAARVSYGKGLTEYERDKKLINYLWKNEHTSPFEQVIVKFHISCPLFVARQWMRHRTASYNELSGRYSVIPDKWYIPLNARIQDEKNKQSSIPTSNSKKSKIMIEKMTNCCTQMYEIYKQLIEIGICREQARMILPQNMYTEFYVTMSLRNWFHFLKLRLDKSAQYEIRVYAEAIFEMLQKITPIATNIFIKSLPFKIKKEEIQSK